MTTPARATSAAARPPAPVCAGRPRSSAARCADRRPDAEPPRTAIARGGQARRGIRRGSRRIKKISGEPFCQKRLGFILQVVVQNVSRCRTRQPRQSLGRVGMENANNVADGRKCIVRQFDREPEYRPDGTAVSEFVDLCEVHFCRASYALARVSVRDKIGPTVLYVNGNYLANLRCSP